MRLSFTTSDDSKQRKLAPAAKSNAVINCWPAHRQCLLMEAGRSGGMRRCHWCGAIAGSQ
jgi:hypothetical protein